MFFIVLLGFDERRRKMGRVKNAGENVACFRCSGGNVKAAKKAFASWKKSPLHYDNLIKNFTNCAVAVVKQDQYYAFTQSFSTPDSSKNNKRLK